MYLPMRKDNVNELRRVSFVCKVITFTLMERLGNEREFFNKTAVINMSSNENVQRLFGCYWKPEKVT